MCAIYSLLALSLNLLNGIAGQVSLGHAAFYAVGAYTSALLAAATGHAAVAVDARGNADGRGDGGL